MNDAVISYATVLYEMDNIDTAIADIRETFNEYPALSDVFDNPTISPTEKENVIEKLFPKILWTFLKIVCQNGRMCDILDIFDTVDLMRREAQSCASATIEYVTPLTPEQRKSMMSFVQRKTGKEKVHLEEKKNPQLIGGFILHIGDDTYDRSIANTASQLQKHLTRR